MYTLLTKIYRAVNKYGLLETNFGKKIFTSAYFFYKRKFEDSYVKLFKEKPQILSGGNVIDVGANIGYTSLLFSRNIKENYKVFAIEPHPSNFQKLEENIARFKQKDKIVAVQSAVGNKDGEITLWENPVSHADHRILTDSFENSLKAQKRFLYVPITTLDSFSKIQKIDKAVSLIKIDVQGYEIPVLEGMKKLLNNNRNAKICLEFDSAMMKDMGFEPKGIFDFFPGYNIYLLTRHKIEKFEVKKGLNSLEANYTDLLFSTNPL